MLLRKLMNDDDDDDQNKEVMFEVTKKTTKLTKQQQQQQKQNQQQGENTVASRYKAVCVRLTSLISIIAGSIFVSVMSLAEHRCISVRQELPVIPIQAVYQ